MNPKLLAGTMSAMMLLAPLAFAQDDKKPSPASPAKTAESKRSGMSDDMSRAIAWERAKDRAAARQASIEARRSGREQNADRVMDEKNPGRKVKDTKAPGAKPDKDN